MLQYIYDLFSDAASISDYTASNYGTNVEWRTGKDLQERIVAYFEALFLYFPNGTKEKEKKTPWF
jgi:hypothetical protein